MSDSILVDTSVLVYAYDRSEPEKQRQALQVLDRLATARVGTISTQVLSEFLIAVTRNIASPLSPDQAHERVENYLQAWAVLDLTGLIVLEAVRGVRDHQFNFWDAQIWATARLNQIAVVFSEDLQGRSIVEGVQFVNPFAADFQIGEWVA